MINWNTAFLRVPYSKINKLLIVIVFKEVLSGMDIYIQRFLELIVNSFFQNFFESRKMRSGQRLIAPAKKSYI